MKKSDKKILKAYAKVVVDSVGNRRALSKKTNERLSAAMRERGYSEQDIAHTVKASPLSGWKLAKLERYIRPQRFRFTKRKVYEYKHFDKRGNAVAGKWRTKTNFQRSLAVRKYWARVKQAVDVYDLPIKEARRLDQMIHDKKRSPEFREALINQFHIVYRETPDLKKKKAAAAAAAKRRQLRKQEGYGAKRG